MAASYLTGISILSVIIALIAISFAVCMYSEFKK
jgi:hypothetical protein